MPKITRKITKIEQQKKNPDRVSVYVNEKFALGLKKSSLLEAGLKKGQEITEEELDELKQKDIEDKNWERVLNYLSYRPRSSSEIRRYLKKKKVEETQTEDIINRLEDLGYLDDLEFAAWWIEQRVRHKPRGRILLYNELAKKGIDKQKIKKALDDLTKIVEEIYEVPEKFADDPEAFLAYKSAKKKAKRYKKEPPQKAKQKLSQYLYRRGFTWEQINKVVDTFIDGG